MFLVNSRLSPFTAPPVSSFFKNHRLKDPFSLSYGAILPSSLTRFLSRALVSSTIPPVSVLVRLPTRFARSYFSAAWSRPIPLGRSLRVHSPFRVAFRRICHPEPPTGLDHHFQSVAGLTFCVTPLRLNHRIGSTGILNLLFHRLRLPAST